MMSIRWGQHKKKMTPNPFSKTELMKYTNYRQEGIKHEKALGLVMKERQWINQTLNPPKQTTLT